MKDEILYQLIKLSVSLLGRIPLRVLRFFADLLGLIWYKLDKRHRVLALENINFSFPDHYSPFEAELMVKKVFKNTAAILFDAIGTYHKTQNEFFEYFIVKNIKYFLKAQKRGRGVVVLTCHMGNFELLVGGTPIVGAKKIYGIYRKFDLQALERFMLEFRQRFGMNMLPTGGLSRKIDFLLKQNSVIGILFDQNAGTYHGVSTDFFGRPACTQNSFAKIIKRTKAAVVPMFVMKKNDKYVIEFLPEIPMETTGCPIKDIEKNTQNYVNAVEQMIRRCPEQYFWVHNRWKTRLYSMLNRAED